MRGKHDTMGSMAAGAVTGAIFKSTGSPWSPPADIYSYLFYIASWHQTGHCCCDSSIRYGRNLELCEKKCLMFVYITLKLPLSWFSHLGQICEVTEEDVRNLTFRLSQISGGWWTDMALIRWHIYRTLDDVSPRSDFTFLVLVAAPRESTINVLAVGWLPATSPNTDSFNWSARRPLSYWWLGRLTVNVFIQLVNVRHIERSFAMMKCIDVDVQVNPQDVLQPWSQTKLGRWGAHVIENPRLAAFSIVPPSQFSPWERWLSDK